MPNKPNSFIQNFTFFNHNRTKSPSLSTYAILDRLINFAQITNKFSVLFLLFSQFIFYFVFLFDFSFHKSFFLGFFLHQFVNLAFVVVQLEQLQFQLLLGLRKDNFLLMLAKFSH